MLLYTCTNINLNPSAKTWSGFLPRIPKLLFLQSFLHTNNKYFTLSEFLNCLGKITRFISSFQNPHTDGPELLVSANPDPIQIIKGNPLYLNCSAEGNPAPSYTWSLPSGSSSHNGSVFTVKAVGFEHDGVYNCSVSNTVGNVEVKFNVHVKGEFCHIQSLQMVIPF